MREINLLPRTRKKMLQQAEMLDLLLRVGRWLALGSLGVAALGFVLLGWFRLVPVAIDEAPQAEERLRQVRTELRGGSNLLEWIKQRDAERIVWSQLLPELLGALPPQVALQQLEADAGGPRIVLGGTVPHRSVLTQLTERVVSLSGVAGVDAPLSNLLVAENSPFRLTVRLVSREVTAAATSSPAPVSSESSSVPREDALLLRWAGVTLVAGGAGLLGVVAVVWAARHWRRWFRREL